MGMGLGVGLGSQRWAKGGVCAPSLGSALEKRESQGWFRAGGRQAIAVCHHRALGLIAYRPLAWGLAGQVHPLPLHPCQKTTSYLWSQPSSSAAWSRCLGHFSIDSPGHSCFALPAGTSL